MGFFLRVIKKIERPPTKASGYFSEMEFTAYFANRLKKAINLVNSAGTTNSDSFCRCELDIYLVRDGKLLERLANFYSKRMKKEKRE